MKPSGRTKEFKRISEDETRSKYVTERGQISAYKFNSFTGDPIWSDQTRKEVEQERLYQERHKRETFKRAQKKGVSAEFEDTQDIVNFKPNQKEVDGLIRGKSLAKPKPKSVKTKSKSKKDNQGDFDLG